MELKEFFKLKEEAEENRREADKAEGAYQEQLSRLKKDCGVSTLKAAKQLLADLEIEKEDKHKELMEALVAFEEEYNERRQG